MKINIPCIYKITNIKTNKIYVGSAKDFGYRIDAHIYDLNRNKHHSKELQEDWNSFGMHNFTFSILEINPLNLLESEQYYIELYDSISNGYNSINAVRSKLLESDVDINCVINEYEIDCIKNNIMIHGNSKYRTTNPMRNFSHSIKWYNNKSNIEQINKTIINVYHGKFKATKNGKHCVWVCYDNLKGLINHRGKIDEFSSTFCSLGRYNKYLIYLMNIYPTANMNVNSEKYALFNLLKWIKENADINSEFHVYCDSERMEFILGKFIELWNNNIQWRNYHKL